jgi:hypothetical protein
VAGLLTILLASVVGKLLLMAAFYNPAKEAL